MEMKGEYRIPASRETVWAALNDPDVLAKCIPGCESIEKLSDTEMTAKVTAKVGPVKASFGGKVNLVDLNPPESYTIQGEGTGGVGFAKGGAKVHLREDGAETVLTYEAQAQIGGKLAQLGARLIDGTARKMADDFFATFAKVVTESAAAATVPAPVPAEAVEAPPLTAGPVPAAPPIHVTPPMPPMPPAPTPEVPTQPTVAAPDHPPSPGTPASAPQGLPPAVWIAGIIVVALGLLLLFL